MATQALRSIMDWLNASVSPSVSWDLDANGFLTPSNLWPNQYANEFGEDGEPVGWALRSGMYEEIVAYHYNASRAGSPKKTSITRQTSAPVPKDQPGWKADVPIATYGRYQGDDPRKPEAPVVVTAPVGARGFDGGQYGWAWGTSDKHRKPTTPTGWRFFVLANNQVPAFPVPPSFNEGSEFWDLYMTRRGGGPETGVLVRKIPISELRGLTEFVLPGPWQRRGPVPSVNLSGVGRTAAPVAGRDAKLLPDRFDTRAGFYQVMRQLGNRRGAGLLSRVSERIRVVGTPEWREVEGTAPAGAQEVQGSGSSGGPPPGGSASAVSAGRPDPRDIRPSGKLPGNEYLGQENDFEESRLVALMNEGREEVGAPLLIVSQVMNRAAHRKASGHARSLSWLAEREGYAGSDLGELLIETESADDALRAIQEHLAYRDASWRSVGVARIGTLWAVVVGEPILDPDYDADEIYCEHLDEFGNVIRHAMGELDEVHADVSLGWDNADRFEDGSGRIVYAYSGSYASAVAAGASMMTGKSGLVVRKQGDGAGAVTVAISDGSLESGVGARTYADGRMTLNSYYFSRGTANHNNAISGHEFGHCGGLGHYTGGPSIMQPSFNLSGGNPTGPSSYDVSELKRLWPAVSGEPTPPAPTPPPPRPPSPTGGTGGTGGTGSTQTITQSQIVNHTGPSAPKPEDPPTASPAPDEPPVRYERVPGEYKRGYGLHCRLPIATRDNPDLDSTYWIRYEAPDGGGIETYRAYPRRAGKDSLFTGQEGTHVVINGYPPDKEPAGLRVGLVSEEEPKVDESVVEAPDPSSIPDAPRAVGAGSPEAGEYLVTVQGVTASGVLTKESEPTSVTINGTTETFFASPVTTLNRLFNAELSQLDAQGKPEGLTVTNAGRAGSGFPTVYEAKDGVLSFETQATISANFPSFAYKPIAVSPDSPLTFAGRLTLTRAIAGGARIVLRQLSETGADLGADLVVAELIQTGAMPFEKRYGAGGIPLAVGAASVVPVIRTSGASVNVTAKVQDPQVVDLPTAIRKVELAPQGSGEADGFDALPTTPVPGNSLVAYGPAPTPPGQDVAEETPPWLLADFENGWPAGTTEVAGGATAVIGPTGAIFGPNGVRISDASVSAKGRYYRTFQIPGDGSSGGNRTLVRVVTLPTYGNVTFCPVFDTQGGLMAVFRLRSDGGLTAIFWNGSSYVERGVSSGISAGDVLDVELVVSGAGAKNAIGTAAMGKNGAPRSAVAPVSGLNLTNRRVKLASLGVDFASDARARWTLDFDRWVVTPRGDVLNREQPATPPGYAPPPVDAPTKGGVPRRLEPESGDPIGQAYALVLPGEGPKTLSLTKRSVAVKPGMGYTLAAFVRWVVFSEASPGVRVWLEGDGVEPILAASLGEMAGLRGWHPTDRPEEDDFATFAVPEAVRDGSSGRVVKAYTRARFEAVLNPGAYLFQEPAFLQGIYPSFEERDAKRGHGRARAGEITATLPTHPPAMRAGPGIETYWSDFGVALASDVDATEAIGDGVDVFFSTSRNDSVFGPETESKDLVVPDAFLRQRILLSGDGRSGPWIPAGGVHLKTWHPEGVLLRKDGSHFSGVAFVGHLVSESTYADTESDTANGHHLSIETSEEITRLRGVPIYVYTERAKQEIEHLSAREELVIETWGAGGEIAGKSYTVRLKGQVLFDVADAPPRLIGGERAIYATTEVEEAEVLEHAPLKGSREIVGVGAHSTTESRRG